MFVINTILTESISLHGISIEISTLQYINWLGIHYLVKFKTIVWDHAIKTSIFQNPQASNSVSMVFKLSYHKSQQNVQSYMQMAKKHYDIIYYSILPCGIFYTLNFSLFLVMCSYNLLPTRTRLHSQNNHLTDEASLSSY